MAPCWRNDFLYTYMPPALAGHWERLDLEGLCAQAREGLEAPTPELQRLGMEALGVKVKVTGQDAQVSLALPRM